MNAKKNQNKRFFLAVILGAAAGGMLIVVAARVLPGWMERTMMNFMRGKMKRMKESGRLSPEMEACMQSCCADAGCGCF